MEQCGNVVGNGVDSTYYELIQTSSQEQYYGKRMRKVIKYVPSEEYIEAFEKSPSKASKIAMSENYEVENESRFNEFKFKEPVRWKFGEDLFFADMKLTTPEDILRNLDYFSFISLAISELHELHSLRLSYNNYERFAFGLRKNNNRAEIMFLDFGNADTFTTPYDDLNGVVRFANNLYGKTDDNISSIIDETQRIYPRFEEELDVDDGVDDRYTLFVDFINDVYNHIVDKLNAYIDEIEASQQDITQEFVLPFDAPKTHMQIYKQIRTRIENNKEMFRKFSNKIEKLPLTGIKVTQGSYLDTIALYCFMSKIYAVKYTAEEEEFIKTYTVLESETK